MANDPEAQSAGHPFDIIVLASEKNKLQEECYAIQHEGDTYFANCNLAAWKIWYCLDNDNTKYAWADTANGKGVIYRMIDEWENDCPYDFKNVQFKRYVVEDISPNALFVDLEWTYIGYNGEMEGLHNIDTSDFVWAYTFSIGDRTTTPNDASIIGYNSTDIGEGYGDKGYYGDNTIKPTSSIITTDNETLSVFCLNNIVWWTNNSRLRSLINGNRIGSECINMTLSGNGTIIEHNCRNLIMGDRCFGNIFNYDCSSISFGNDCFNNTFGNDCYGNTFGNMCIDITFGNNCGHNTFGNNCSNNTFGSYCYGNKFGNYFQYNTFEVNCYDNKFGNYCKSNTFGNNCISITFGNYCISITFGNYFQNNTLGNDIEYVKITTDNIYHTQVLNGTKGTYDKYLTIAFTPQTKYSQFAGLTSRGVLEKWVEADTPHYVVDGGTY